MHQKFSLLDLALPVYISNKGKTFKERIIYFHHQLFLCLCIYDFWEMPIDSGLKILFGAQSWAEFPVTLEPANGCSRFHVRKEMAKWKYSLPCQVMKAPRKIQRVNFSLILLPLLQVLLNYCKSPWIGGSSSVVTCSSSSSVVTCHYLCVLLKRL